MNRSNPSTVVGGGEMKRATSSVASIDSSDGASESRSSRRVTLDPFSTGSALCQSEVVTLFAASMTACTSRFGSESRKGIFSIRGPLPCPAWWSSSWSSSHPATW